mgnify:CR=1 FL=1
MESIDLLQKRLDEKGVRDIKVFIDPDAKFTKDELKDELVEILNFHLDGESKPYSLIGDGDKLLRWKGAEAP